MSQRVSSEVARAVLAAGDKGFTGVLDCARDEYQVRVFLDHGLVVAVTSPQCPFPGAQLVRTATGRMPPGGADPLEHLVTVAQVERSRVNALVQDWSHALAAAALTWPRVKVVKRRRVAPDGPHMSAVSAAAFVQTLRDRQARMSRTWQSVRTRAAAAGWSAPPGTGHPCAVLAITVAGQDHLRGDAPIDELAYRNGRTRSSVLDHVAGVLDAAQAQGDDVGFRAVQPAGDMPVPAVPEELASPTAGEDEQACAPGSIRREPGPDLRAVTAGATSREPGAPIPAPPGEPVPVTTPKGSGLELMDAWVRAAMAPGEQNARAHVLDTVRQAAVDLARRRIADVNEAVSELRAAGAVLSERRAAEQRARTRVQAAGEEVSRAEQHMAQIERDGVELALARQRARDEQAQRRSALQAARSQVADLRAMLERAEAEADRAHRAVAASEVDVAVAEEQYRQRVEVRVLDIRHQLEQIRADRLAPAEQQLGVEQRRLADAQDALRDQQERARDLVEAASTQVRVVGDLMSADGIEHDLISQLEELMHTVESAGSTEQIDPALAADDPTHGRRRSAQTDAITTVSAKLRAVPAV